MAKRLSDDELEAMAELYARTVRDKYLPAPVERRSSQIRGLIEEVKMWRESAGERTDG